MKHDCGDENCVYDKALREVDSLLAYHEVMPVVRERARSLLSRLFKVVETSSRVAAVKEVMRIINKGKPNE